MAAAVSASSLTSSPFLMSRVLTYFDDDSSPSSLSPPPPPPQEPLAYQTLFYDNTIDHFDNEGSQTFEHRYLLNDEYFVNDENSTTTTGTCPGPIFFYAGNELSIYYNWNCTTGFVHYLTQKYGALVVYSEERYYGTSIPTEECCTYLSTQQILADYVELIQHIKTQYRAQSCPTIAFGGSYGGSLAAFMRYRYPDIVQGALASSAELGYYDLNGWAERNISEYTWSSIVAEQYNKVSLHIDNEEGGTTTTCLDVINKARDAIDATLENQTVLDAFNFCDDKSLQPNKSSLFIYGLESLPQINYPYEADGRPAWPVSYVCNLLLGDNDVEGSSSLLDRAAQVTAVTIGYDLQDHKDCLPPFDYFGPGNVPGDGPGPGSWGYQSCTETLHRFSSSTAGDRKGIRSFDYDTEIDDILQTMCFDLYGVVPDMDKLTELYGGFDMAKMSSNTIFSSGGIDPWGGAALTQRDGGDGDDAKRRGVYFFRMEHAAHMLDLRGWNPLDPPDVIETRYQEEKIIMNWVNDWLNSNDAKNNLDQD